MEFLFKGGKDAVSKTVGIVCISILDKAILKYAFSEIIKKKFRFYLNILRIRLETLVELSCGREIADFLRGIGILVRSVLRAIRNEVKFF